MLASSASLTQLTVTTTPYKAQPLRPPLLSFDGYAEELLVSHHASSRTPLPAHTARKHCSCFSAANSAFCARLIAQHQEDQPEAVSEAKTSFHRAKEADSFTYHRLQVHLPAPTTVGSLDLRHVFGSKKVLVFNAMEDITNDEYLARS